MVYYLAGGTSFRSEGRPFGPGLTSMRRGYRRLKLKSKFRVEIFDTSNLY